MPIRHVVQQGDCISSLAAEYGFRPDTIWNHPANTDLKRNRRNPNILLEGDIVTIPDKVLRKESRPTDKCHRFRLLGVPEKLKMVLRDDRHLPRKSVRYVLAVDGDLRKGTTDSSGRIEVFIPPGAREGQLTVIDGDTIEEYPLHFGHLNPITELSGVQMRLSNLGFECGAADGEMNAETIEALKQFQESKGLQPTGELDDNTRKKLEDVYGS